MSSYPNMGTQAQSPNKFAANVKKPERNLVNTQPKPTSATIADPVQKARKQLGYRNSWNRHDVDISKQVVFNTALGQDPKVAIIGGGLSGLVCARELAAKGCRVAVFDTGEHGVGGRLATRATKDKSLRSSWYNEEYSISNLMFDHAAQYFTVSDPQFQKMVDQWVEAGVVRPWDGPVGTLERGNFTPFPATPTRYIASNGMRSLARHIESDLLQRYGQNGIVEVRRPLWVSRMSADLKAQGWVLSGGPRSQGTFDAVVIAHNGKCANRLVGPTGAPYVAKQLMGLRLSALWALMVAFDGPLPPPADLLQGAMIRGSSALSWVANNTAKLGLQHLPKKLSCWTLFSTNAYGQANKVPQENIPAEVQEKVKEDLLGAFSASLGVPRAALPPVVFSRCQLWGAALPTNSPGVDCILDPFSRVGVCGDWLSGGSMQAAAMSGAALARELAGLRGKVVQGSLPEIGIGLSAPFKPLKMQEIGEFPS